MNWHQKNIEEVFHELHSSPDGITEEESRIRIERFGQNVLKEKKKKTLFMIFLDQLSSIVFLAVEAEKMLKRWKSR